MRLSIRLKIILPFAVLLIFVGVIGTAVATARLTDAAAAVFDANLLRSSLVANQSMARVGPGRGRLPGGEGAGRSRSANRWPGWPGRFRARLSRMGPAGRVPARSAARRWGMGQAGAS